MSDQWKQTHANQLNSLDRWTLRIVFVVLLILFILLKVNGG